MGGIVFLKYPPHPAWIETNCYLGGLRIESVGVWNESRGKYTTQIKHHALPQKKRGPVNELFWVRYPSMQCLWDNNVCSACSFPQPSRSESRKYLSLWTLRKTLASPFKGPPESVLLQAQPHSPVIQIGVSLGVDLEKRKISELRSCNHSVCRTFRTILKKFAFLRWRNF